MADVQIAVRLGREAGADLGGIQRAGRVGIGALAGIDPVVKAIDAAKGVAGSAGSLREPLATIKTIMVDTLGIQPDLVLPIVLVAGGIYIMYWRKRQRDEGRA